VLGYDATESAREALAWAASELMPGGRLVIVHACKPLHAPPPPLTTRQERAHVGRAVIDEILLEAADSLSELLADSPIPVIAVPRGAGAPAPASGN
jgi:hypothetical protein